MSKKKVLNKESIETKGIEKYSCSICNIDHKRFKNKAKGIISKIFMEHLEYRIFLSNTERFKKDFKRKWKKEAMKKTSLNFPILKIN